MFYNEKSDSGVFESDSFEPFPDNTMLVSCIDDAKTVYDDRDDEEYINLRWIVIEGEHTKRKLFQKLRVNSADKDRCERANKMIMAIDYNCGNHLAKLGRYPSDDELKSALSNKPMRIVAGVWEQDGKKGNWIKSVYGMSDELPDKKTESKEDEPF